VRFPPRRDGTGSLLEHEPETVQQLALEEDAVNADARGERQPELAAGQVARNEPGLQPRLAHAALREPRTPLLIVSK